MRCPMTVQRILERVADDLKTIDVQRLKGDAAFHYKHTRLAMTICRIALELNVWQECYIVQLRLAYTSLLKAL